MLPLLNRRLDGNLQGKFGPASGAKTDFTTCGEPIVGLFSS